MTNDGVRNTSTSTKYTDADTLHGHEHDPLTRSAVRRLRS